MCAEKVSKRVNEFCLSCSHQRACIHLHRLLTKNDSGPALYIRDSFFALPSDCRQKQTSMIHSELFTQRAI